MAEDNSKSAPLSTTVPGSKPSWIFDKPPQLGPAPTSQPTASNMLSFGTKPGALSLPGAPVPPRSEAVPAPSPFISFPGAWSNPLLTTSFLPPSQPTDIKSKPADLFPPPPESKAKDMSTTKSPDTLPLFRILILVHA